MSGRPQMTIPYCLALQLEMTDGAEQGSCRRVAGMFVLDSSRCALVLEERSHVCHDESRLGVFEARRAS